jgi:hemerythrin superfamily protein
MVHRDHFGTDERKDPFVDAITLLKDDHKTVEGLFKRFEQAGDRAYASKRKLVDRMIHELAVHASIEEQLFYPAARERVANAQDVVLESLEEHHIVKWTLSELEKMDPQDERFDAKVTVLIESVRHHVKEEEKDMFPKIRKAMGTADLKELGQRMAAAKKTAPIRPHPKAPDEPPGNLVAGPASSAIDKGKDVAATVAKAVKPKKR